LRYFGGKFRIANDISDIINHCIYNKDYVEPFCGSCNVISKVLTKGNRFAYDSNYYLIEMWKAIQEGWIPPTEISEKEYYFFKENKDYNPSMTAFVGFACSFSGKWFGGYARASRGDNFAKNGSSSLIKQRKSILNVKFETSDYKDLSFNNKFIYCDPPYANTTKYNGCNFDYKEYLNWVKEQSKTNVVICSEYKDSVPYDGLLLWEKQSKKEIRDKNNKRKETTEVLWTYNKVKI
jgi:DNA adenine methylase